jgi:hypothetical protein
MIEPNDHRSSVQILTLSGTPLPVDLEFKPVPPTEAFKAHGLSMGRCFGSKSAYARANPKREFVPNANVFTKRHGKVWWGDLDLSRDKPALEKIAHQLRCRLYVLTEFDGRFEEAERPHAEVVNAAVWQTGGRVHVQGRREFLNRSGLSSAEAAFLLRLSPGRFDRRQEPKVALEIGRRMRQLEDVFAPIASKEGRRKWGYWWTRPHAKLAGRCPMRVLKSGETLDFAVLTEPTVGIFFFAMKYSLMTRL